MNSEWADLALAARTTFSEMEMNLAPALLARAGNEGSPGKVCSTAPRFAISCACLRAALARASSHRRAGRLRALRSRLTDWKRVRSAGLDRAIARVCVRSRRTMARLLDFIAWL